MARSARLTALAAVALCAALAAGLAAWGLLWIWWETYSFEGTRGEALREAFMIPVVTFVLGSAIGVLAGSGAAWVVERVAHTLKPVGRVAFYAAPPGALVAAAIFAGGV